MSLLNGRDHSDRYSDAGAQCSGRMAEKTRAAGRGSKIGVGMALGVGVGAVMGVATGDMGVGVAMGVAVGGALGIAYTR